MSKFYFVAIDMGQLCNKRSDNGVCFSDNEQAKKFRSSMIRKAKKEDRECGCYVNEELAIRLIPSNDNYGFHVYDTAKDAKKDSLENPMPYEKDSTILVERDKGGRVISILN